MMTFGKRALLFMGLASLVVTEACIVYRCCERCQETRPQPTTLASAPPCSEPDGGNLINNDGGPNVPPPPTPGEQEIVKIDSGRSCAQDVETAITVWAAARSLSVRVLYSSDVARDIELLPETHLTQVAKNASITVAAFEADCELFTDRYAQNPAMKEKLRQYLGEIQLLPAAISEKTLLSKGFTNKDVIHLRDHLPRFITENTTVSTDARYVGIRYFRITYSVSPNSEYSVNTGTVATHTPTPDQRALISDMKAVINKAVACGEAT